MAFYEEDKKMQCRLAPKLTEAHFNLKPFGAKMRVKKAAQVLSHSVAAGISTYVHFGKFNKRAEGTARFADMVNNLFDLLNSSQPNGVSVYRRALRPGSPAFDILDEMSQWLHSWKTIDNDGRNITSTYKFIRGWITNIEATKQLSTYLFEDKNFEFFCTRRVCTDALENFFAMIRSRHGFNQNPSPIAFSHSFRQTVMQ